MRGDVKQGNENYRPIVLITLHVLLLIYSASGLFSKSASMEQFGSVSFFLFYVGMLFVLGIYAIGWQQILKRLPLTVAFANKAVTVIWGMLWGAVFFNESITFPMIIGATVVMIGVVLYSYSDRETENKTVN